MVMDRKVQEARFWSRVAIVEGDGCWLWQGHSDGRGYGLTRLDGRPARAHRVSWVFTNGPVPDGLLIRHQCDTPSCVRPDHLELGTHQQNMADRRARPKPALPTGNGHVRRRGSNRWEVVIELGRDPLTRKRRQVSRMVRGSRQDALLVRAQMVTEATTNPIGTQQRGSFGELLDSWLAKNRAGWSPSTRRQTESIVERYVRPAFGTVPLRHIHARDLDLFYVALPLKPSTVRRVHGVIHAALEQATRWDLIPSNPASRASPPPVKTAEVVPPDAAEVMRLIAAAEDRDPDLAVFLRLAAVTGARRAELCALRWADLDTTSVTIARSLVDAGQGSIEVKGTKTEIRRRIALDAVTLKIVERHRLICAERALSVGAKPDWVFESIRRPGEPWRPDNVSHRFRALRDELGLTLRLHDLRHANASWLLALGVDVRTTAGRLGHADGGRQTLGRYGHVMPAADLAAAERLGEMLEGRG